MRWVYMSIEDDIAGNNSVAAIEAESTIETLLRTDLAAERVAAQLNAEMQDDAAEIICATKTDIDVLLRFIRKLQNEQREIKNREYTSTSVWYSWLEFLTMLVIFLSFLSTIITLCAIAINPECHEEGNVFYALWNIFQSSSKSLSTKVTLAILIISCVLFTVCCVTYATIHGKAQKTQDELSSQLCQNTRIYAELRPTIDYQVLMAQKNLRISCEFIKTRIDLLESNSISSGSLGYIEEKIQRDNKNLIHTLGSRVTAHLEKMDECMRNFLKNMLHNSQASSKTTRDEIAALTERVSFNETKFKDTSEDLRQYLELHLDVIHTILQADQRKNARKLLNYKSILNACYASIADILQNSVTETKISIEQCLQLHGNCLQAVLRTVVDSEVDAEPIATCVILLETHARMQATGHYKSACVYERAKKKLKNSFPGLSKTLFNDNLAVHEVLADIYDALTKELAPIYGLSETLCNIIEKESSSLHQYRDICKNISRNCVMALFGKNGVLNHEGKQKCFYRSMFSIVQNGLEENAKGYEELENIKSCASRLILIPYMMKLMQSPKSAHNDINCMSDVLHSVFASLNDIPPALSQSTNSASHPVITQKALHVGKIISENAR
ncbi:hypothetical protein AB9K21_00145 [Anaplasma phagocytophilum]|uniref:hypothetical protein n=1 Tax=Anaplasma phagocytophilum TaxID=948 RepID=UPI001249C7F8